MTRAAIMPAFCGRLLRGGALPQLAYPEAASQTFVKGDLVYLAGGYLTICGADPSLVLGISMEDAHNTTAGLYEVSVQLITADTLIEMSVYHSTAANDKIEATDFGTLYGIVKSSAGYWAIDKTDTTNTRARVLHFFDAVGDAKGRVGVIFLAANRYFA